MSKGVPTSVRFDEAAKARLDALSQRTKIPVKTLIEMGVDWFLEQIAIGKSIPIPADTLLAEEQAEYRFGEKQSKPGAGAGPTSEPKVVHAAASASAKKPTSTKRIPPPPQSNAGGR